MNANSKPKMPRRCPARLCYLVTIVHGMLFFGAVSESAYRQCILRRRALPRGHEIRWSQRVLRRLCGRQRNPFWSSLGPELTRSKVLPQNLDESFGTCLKTVAKRNSAPRSNHTSFLLPIANMQRICHHAGRRGNDLVHTDLRFGHRLRATVWQQK
jgi:hypothetical protein